MKPRWPARFRMLSWPERLTLCEAAICLAFARVAIATLPFRSVAALASGSWISPQPAAQERAETVRRVRWAVLAAARRVPFRAVCFQQGLAAQIMLRRRGIPSSLYYGAAQDKALGLISHVWVRDGEMNVTGCEEATRFAVLACFPPLKAGA